MQIEKYTDMIYACGRCNFCKGQEFNERCPEVFTQFWESSTARGRMAIARGILEGTLKYTDELAERIYGCFLCARCKEECKKAANIDIIAITKAMRQDFVEQGVRIPETSEQMVDSMESSGNIFSDTPAVHNKWSVGLEFKKESGILFYPGCLASHRFKEKTRILVKVLQSAGYDLDFLEEDQVCCGTPLWISGYMNKARNWVERIMQLFEEHRVKEIITPCPSCYRAFIEEYPKILGIEELPIKVRHSSEVLERIVLEKKLNLKHSVDMTMTYHDPCEIGRYRGIYEQPRNVLRGISGLKLVEMERNQENSFCCGGGGGVKLAYPDYSLKVSVERIKEAISTGAKAITTVCPACELNLTHAVYEEDLMVRVLDIAEVLAVAAGIEDEEILEPDYFADD